MDRVMNEKYCSVIDLKVEAQLKRLNEEVKQLKESINSANIAQTKTATALNLLTAIIALAGVATAVASFT